MFREKREQAVRLVWEARELRARSHTAFQVAIKHLDYIPKLSKVTE